MFDPLFWRVAALPVVLGLLAPMAVQSGSPHYTVVTDERLQHLDIRACFEGEVPRRLIARDERAADLLRSARLQARDVIVLDPALWLWYPDGVREDERWQLDFVLPPGYDVSAPWHRLGRSEGTVTYEVRDHSFMRVYWSGAAIALLADVKLRRRSGGAQSLDTALAAFGECCLPADRSWSARELMQQLDRLTGTTVFIQLYRKYVDSDDFPELDAVYAELGLQPISATRLRLDPTAPGAAIREAIMVAQDGDLYLQDDFGNYRRVGEVP